MVLIVAWWCCFAPSRLAISTIPSTLTGHSNKKIYRLLKEEYDPDSIVLHFSVLGLKGELYRILVILYVPS
jgi:hypothetical protein